MQEAEKGTEHVMWRALARCPGCLLSTHHSLHPIMAPEGPSSTHWMLQIISDVNGLAGSYTIFLFLGAVPDDPEEWDASPSLAGQHNAFSSSEDQEECITQSVVYLDSFLKETHHNLPDAASVSAFVDKELRWRIKTVRTAIYAAYVLK
jgi:tyrosinase